MTGKWIADHFTMNPYVVKLRVKMEQDHVSVGFIMTRHRDHVCVGLIMTRDRDHVCVGLIMTRDRDHVCVGSL